MFRFFNKKQDNYEDFEQTEENKDSLASITYVMKKGSDGPLIDIELMDYDEESIDALCVLLDILGDDMCFIDTVGIIKSSLLADQKHDVLVKVFSKINDKIKSRILSINKEKTKDEPVIKPSEMIS